ncbi:recombinase family protein [Congzhengia sp.]|uniref:recombinase family protein n=1 Tax=Congzhengia sp. TaxID=2944168 RepID=UPI0030779A4E
MKGLAYGRLSRDEDSEQESLKNQEDLVVGYMNKNNHTVIEIAMDDNYTGMNYDRPGIKRMFELARERMIDAVFVKDLSRLGRHRTLTLECIDKLKLLGVRVISVTENIDSFNDEDDLLIGFKGLINDSYSKDIQRKVIYGFRQKQQKGLVMIPPMGYFKDKNTNEVVIVEEPAEIVRTIFKLYLEDYGLKAVARILNEKGMKSPAYYQLKLIGKKQGYNKPKITSRFLWDYSSVKRILQNEFYCGTVVNHQNERSRITKKQVAVPAEEQYRHENMVLAIVTREMWERVQEFLNAKVRKNVRASESKPCHKYAGLLECSDCGCSFVAKIRKTKGNPDRVEYVCNGYHRYSDVNCTSHRIREEMLDKIVQAELEGIRLVFDDLWENVEDDVKKWAAGKSTTEKRLENLKDKIAGTELEIQKILMERIEDKQNADMYDKMIETRRDDIEKFKKEVYEIENLDKTIKERKSTLKHSIELLDDIIAENNISNANLHLMFDKIIIEETDEGLNLDLKLKSPFISKAKEPLLKKYMIVDNEVLQEGA